MKVSFCSFSRHHYHASLYCLLYYQAWEMCRAGAFNLSYTSLTSRKASKALRGLVTEDPMFWAEITQPRSRGGTPQHVPPALTSQQEQSEDREEPALDIHGDDSEVPVMDVFAHTQQSSQAMDCNNDRLYVPGEDGGLASTADAESSSTEFVKGETVDASQAIEGRGK